MKTAFSMHPVIVDVLILAYGDNVAGRVERAVHSSLEEHALIKSADAKRSPVKLKSTGKGEAKRSVTSFSEAERHTYQAGATGPSRFAAWHDAQVSVWEKHGEPSDSLTVAILPAHLTVWIAGFKPAVAGPVQVDGARPEAAETKGNGKRNRSVEPVAAPQAPA